MNDNKSRWQQEYEALPQWARELVDSLKSCTGYGGGGPSEGLMNESTRVYFKTGEEASIFMWAIAEACEFTKALSAPFPPLPPPDRERRVFNIVELAADAEGEDDCAFDQPCCFGHRVEHHAVYCHNKAWPDSPRKCHRNREDYWHEDCPGFVANPEYKSAEGSE